MADPNPLAAFNPPGLVKVDQALQKKDTKAPERNKYREFLAAIHEAAFSRDNLDQQTRLEWENIEGEVMGSVLTQDIISGIMFLRVEDPFWHYDTPQEALDRLFVNKFVETVGKNRHLFPGITTLNLSLNRLMVSYQGKGREEIIRMLQSFQISMQEQEHNDPLKQAIRRGL
jgi:hypothetical protein